MRRVLEIGIAMIALIGPKPALLGAQARSVRLALSRCDVPSASWTTDDLVAQLELELADAGYVLSNDASADLVLMVDRRECLDRWVVLQVVEYGERSEREDVEIEREVQVARLLALRATELIAHRDALRSPLVQPEVAADAPPAAVASAAEPHPEALTAPVRDPNASAVSGYLSLDLGGSVSGTSLYGSGVFSGGLRARSIAVQAGFTLGGAQTRVREFDELRFLRLGATLTLSWRWIWHRWGFDLGPFAAGGAVVAEGVRYGGSGEGVSTTVPWFDLGGAFRVSFAVGIGIEIAWTIGIGHSLVSVVFLDQYGTTIASLQGVTGNADFGIAWSGP
jgi:hypothetical protein